MIGEAAFLLKTSKGMINRAKIASYSFSNMLRRLTRSSTAQRVMKIDFKELSLVFKTFSSELTSYFEIYLQKVYEREPGFLAQPGDIVFDVGANIGVYSIRQAKQGAIVYAFEPNPDAFSRLKQNIPLNSLENVTLTPKAVHCDSSKVTFFMNPRSTVAGKVAGAEEQLNKLHCVDIEAVSLDEFAKTIKCPSISILKIDTEGHELEVLEGATATLAKTEKIILEYHSSKQREQLIKTIATNNEFKLVRDLSQYNVLYFKRR